MTDDVKRTAMEEWRLRAWEKLPHELRAELQLILMEVVDGRQDLETFAAWVKGLPMKEQVRLHSAGIQPFGSERALASPEFRAALHTMIEQAAQTFQEYQEREARIAVDSAK